MIVERAQRAEVARLVRKAKPVQVLGRAEVREPVGAEIHELDPGRQLIDHEIVRAARHHCLAAVDDRAHAGTTGDSPAELSRESVARVEGVAGVDVKVGRGLEDCQQRVQRPIESRDDHAVRGRPSPIGAPVLCYSRRQHLRMRAARLAHCLGSGDPAALGRIEIRDEEGHRSRGARRVAGCTSAHRRHHFVMRSGCLTDRTLAWR